jgi:hypothetical protein
MYRSLDLGVTWTASGGSTISQYFRDGINVSREKMLALAFTKGIYKTTNEGVTWGAVFTQSQQNFRALTMSKGNIIYFANKTNVYNSTDLGVTWTMGKNTIPNVFDIATSTNGKLYAICSQKNGVYRSTDHGNSWQVTPDSSAIAPANIIRTDDGRLFVSSWTTGIYTSSDNGDTWVPLNEGLYDLGIEFLYITPSGEVLATTTLGGIYKLTGVTSIEEEPSENIPKTFSLAQNFPNPFNPETVIRFQLPVAGYVKGVVYDILGREVAILINGEMPAGYHEIKFNASNLPNGVYMYEISSGDFRAVRKMILLK